jgi:hypothetical protein
MFLVLISVFWCGLAGAQSDRKPMIQYIGTATMSDDGTIALKLVMTGGGRPADALLTYKTDSPDYQEILHHLGGMKPGETKPVTPWPD